MKNKKAGSRLFPFLLPEHLDFVVLQEWQKPELGGQPKACDQLRHCWGLGQQAEPVSRMQEFYSPYQYKMRTGRRVQDPKNFVIYGWPLTEAKYSSKSTQILSVYCFNLSCTVDITTGNQTRIPDSRYGLISFWMTLVCPQGNLLPTFPSFSSLWFLQTMNHHPWSQSVDRTADWDQVLS